MPIYEYQCKKCGQFELMQKITAAHLKRCPTCRGKVTKLISNSSFHLKGTGWYVTDYASKDGKSKESGSETKDSKTATSTTAPESTSSKSDTKESKPSAPPADTKSKADTKASSSKEANAA